MFVRFGFLFLCTCLLSSPLSAWTGDSLNYLTPKDTIFIYQASSGEKIFEHQIEPKQTLFSMARFYGLSLEEVYAFNPELRGQEIAVGTHVRIPIPNRAILRYLDSEEQLRELVPVCYVVRPGETLYRISKTYFKMPVDIVMYRNKLKDVSIQPGETLLMGWMSIYGIPDSVRSAVGGPLWQKSHSLRQQFSAQILDKRPTEERGIAHWQRDSKMSSTELMALHRKAPLGAILEVHNPMTGKKIYVKVVGRIPAFYEENQIVILSPTVAQMLGALDPNFYVQVRY
ncbi:MAG: LysM peptidoglycan-binding domain-containing protein [Phaeodactylibacter sp.]|nr:LysM peptidoglycan-binding domain-containing protein [Phaeodactylibacter sp.]